eukprot:TRINITY_DN1922_c0_g1_i1.p1 TRINITY_DN1922_c0_g1~~TRINITY_DN1922_c0_g1_i1.p1  ORF type:complete len:286 (+),score=48.24 TRINITY_DN1922_c0_g1_i1:68-925(+)
MCNEIQSPNVADEKMVLECSREPEMLQTSFKGQFIKKVSKMDLRGLDTRDVMIELGLIALPLAVGATGAWMNARRWQQKKFLETMHYSLNTVSRSKKFAFRTLGEETISKVLPTEGVRRVQKAAEHVTNENPIINLDKETTWLVNNAIANQISADCSQAFIARDLGSTDVISTWYITMLTAEPTGIANMKKIRAMVIKEDLLKALSDPEKAKSISLENPGYKIRWALMQKLANMYNEEVIATGKQNAKFFRFELCSLVGKCDSAAYDWLKGPEKQPELLVRYKAI